MSSPGDFANASSAPATPATGAASATKPLWAAIGVLGVSVLAMGASLVYNNKRPAEPVPVVAASITAPNAGAIASKTAKDAILTETADGKPVAVTKTQKAAQDRPAQPVAKVVPKPAPPKATAAQPANAVAANSPAQANPSTSASTSPAANQPTGYAGAPAPLPTQPVVAQQQAQAKPVCTNCGTIVAVTPVTRPGTASGVGVIAGGVLGGVLGNQVGKGDGRTAATVLGAVGGGWAGNAVEKNMKKETAYSVRVRMDDGSTRTVEQASAPAVGAKVTVDGSSLRGSEGAVYAPSPAQEQGSTLTAGK